MSNRSLLEAIEALKLEAQTLVEVLAADDAKRARTARRLETVNAALENLQEVAAGYEVDGPGLATSGEVATVSKTRSRRLSSPSSISTKPSVPITRVPSVRRLGDIVARADRVFSREELFASYMYKYGTGTWKEPRNVLSTALGRAIERGLIRDLGGDRYSRGESMTVNGGAHR